MNLSSGFFSIYPWFTNRNRQLRRPRHRRHVDDQMSNNLRGQTTNRQLFEEGDAWIQRRILRGRGGWSVSEAGERVSHHQLPPPHQTAGARRRQDEGERESNVLNASRCLTRRSEVPIQSRWTTIKPGGTGSPPPRFPGLKPEKAKTSQEEATRPPRGLVGC